MQDSGDAVPQARANPAGIASIKCLPGTRGRWDLAPRPAAAHHGEHALELTAQIAAGMPSTWPGRLKERRNLRPGGLAERGRAGHEEDGERCSRGGSGLGRRWTLRSSVLMAPARHRLVLAAP